MLVKRDSKRYTKVHKQNTRKRRIGNGRKIRITMQVLSSCLSLVSTKLHNKSVSSFSDSVYMMYDSAPREIVDCYFF